MFGCGASDPLQLLPSIYILHVIFLKSKILLNSKIHLAWWDCIHACMCFEITHALCIARKHKIQCMKQKQNHWMRWWEYLAFIYSITYSFKKLSLNLIMWYLTYNTSQILKCHISIHSLLIITVDCFNWLPSSISIIHQSIKTILIINTRYLVVLSD